jgi:hypothetical protein
MAEWLKNRQKCAKWAQSFAFCPLQTPGKWREPRATNPSKIARAIDAGDGYCLVPAYTTGVQRDTSGHKSHKHQRSKKIDKREDTTKQAPNTTAFRRSTVVRTSSVRTYRSGPIRNEVDRASNSNTFMSSLDNGGTAFSGLTAKS